jgi:hypothetical protein
MSQPQAHHESGNNPAADSSNFSNGSLLISIYTFGAISGWPKAVAAAQVVSLSLPTLKNAVNK